MSTSAPLTDATTGSSSSEPKSTSVEDCTPESSQDFGVNSNVFVTPVKLQNKRLLDVKDDGAKTPALRVPASPLMKRLGYGTGVGVYLLERSPRPNGEIRSPWAIKKLAKIKQVKQVMYSDRLVYEATILKSLDHPNIIGYRAFENPTDSNAYLAMERGSHSLSDLIEDRVDAGVEAEMGDYRPNPFPASNIVKVALDIAHALDYLHTKMKLVHGDLKSANVLIFQDFETCKLCDFGVSRKLKADGTLHGSYIGTEIWNPMEVILKQRGTPKYPITSKVDIYPFGLTLFEMISLKAPHVETADDEVSGISDIDTDDSFDEDAFEEALQLRVGTRPHLPAIEFNESYNKVLEVFYCCTEEDPSARPTPEQIISNLCISDLKLTTAEAEESLFRLSEFQAK